MTPGTAVVGRLSAGGTQYGRVLDIGVQRGQLVVYVRWAPPRPGVRGKRWRDCVPRSQVTVRVP